MNFKLRNLFSLWVLIFGLAITSAVAAEAPAARKPAAAEVMPSPAPIFAATFADFDGKPMVLAELKGKVTVLNFWATWCSPCRTEIPHLVAGQKKYGPRGVVFIGAAVEDKAESVRDFAKAYEINYTVAMAGSEQGIALLRALGNKVAGLPFTVILDRQGNIAAAKRGVLTPERLQQVLDPLLQ
ncbi:MAG: TlpA disulfide reductase family protein [Sulfuricella sp.]|nr:TlpA disulfide reductase family protein [Sulfuricella sp.]